MDSRRVAGFTCDAYLGIRFCKALIRSAILSSSDSRYLNLKCSEAVRSTVAQVRNASAVHGQFTDSRQKSSGFQIVPMDNLMCHQLCFSNRRPWYERINDVRGCSLLAGANKHSVKSVSACNFRYISNGTEECISRSIVLTLA
jgi:hypothetical protein